MIPCFLFSNDEQLIAASKLIRQFHNITQNSNLRGKCEVICHNDLSPCNTVFKENLPIAFIDFDVAAPGTRRRDLSYAVWMWCQLGEEDERYTAKEQARRIKLMCNAYGLINKHDFIDDIKNIMQEVRYKM